MVDRIPLEAWYHIVDPLPKTYVLRLWFIHSFRDIEERLYEHCLQPNSLRAGLGWCVASVPLPSGLNTGSNPGEGRVLKKIHCVHWYQCKMIKLFNLKILKILKMLKDISSFIL